MPKAFTVGVFCNVVTEEICTVMKFVPSGAEGGAAFFVTDRLKHVRPAEDEISFMTECGQLLLAANGEIRVNIDATEI